MTILAILAGSVIGKLYDPLAWCMIVIIVLLASQRFAWWATLATIVAATLANFAFIHPRLVEMGLRLDAARQARIFFALLIIGVVAHGIGRGIGLLARPRAGERRA